MAVLRTENLQKIYGHRLVVKGIDIAVNTGEIIALLGRNGAGKTTTFQMMVGLIKPDSGTIYLDGTDISRHTSNQRADKGITYLPQENSVFLKTTVEKNLTMILELKKYNKDEVETIADQLLKELGLQSLRKQPAFSLSGGERRRLEICRALVLDPKFLLLDEPFTGIDPLTIVEIQRILLRLKKKGIGIILSDHNVRDALKITDNGYVMDHGKILIEGNPQQIAANAMAKERFLGENFKLGDEIVDYDSSEKR
jgi:lipopolysaccharide export system ATP-binding protein